MQTSGRKRKGATTRQFASAALRNLTGSASHHGILAIWLSDVFLL